MDGEEVKTIHAETVTQGAKTVGHHETRIHAPEPPGPFARRASPDVSKYSWVGGVPPSGG